MNLNASDPIVQQIIGARVYLLFNHPFFGQISTYLKPVDATPWCPTAATDGKHLYYNREFIKSLTKQELVFLIGHEVLHCVFDHIGRRGSRLPDYWNAAIDYITNYVLVKNKIGSMPKGGLYSDKYTDEMSSEQVYNMLIKQISSKKNGCGEDGCGDGDPSKKGKNGLGKTIDVHLNQGEDNNQNVQGSKGIGAWDNQGYPIVVDRTQGWKDPNGNPDPGNKTGYSSPIPLTEDDINNIKNNIRAVLIGAVQSNSGNLPGSIHRMVDSILEPKLDWKQLLEAKIQSYYKDDYSFKKLSKRTWSTGCVLPGSELIQTIRVAVSIDTSGSISDGMIKSFLGEVQGIMEQFPGYEIHIWSIDSVIYEDTYKIYTPENGSTLFDYKARGGGGNDFPKNWTFMQENDLVPEVFVVFSDGYPCGSWGDPNYCETIFVIKNSWDKNITAPFGLTVYMDDEGVDS